VAPGVERGLQGLDGLERPVVIEQLVLERLVQPLDLPRGRGRGWFREPLDDAVLPADPLEQHLSRTGLDEPASKYRAVVAEDFLGHAIDGHGIQEGLADRPGSGPDHGFSDNAVPGMIVDAGHDLHLAAVGQERARRHIKLPQLHRDRAFPPLVVLPPALTGPRFDQAVADKHPVDRGASYRAVPAAVHLEHQPLRPPLRMSPSQLADRRLHLRHGLPRMLMNLVAAVGQAGWSFSPVAAQPGVHALTADPVPVGDFGHRHSGQNFQHSPVPLLGHTQLP
jgi:hypothetical protein